MSNPSKIVTNPVRFTSFKARMEQMDIHLEHPVMMSRCRDGNDECLWIEQADSEGCLWFSWLEDRAVKRFRIADLELFEHLKRLIAGGCTLPQIVDFLASQQSAV